MREERTYWVYILASRQYGTLYTGVTNDLARRVYEHKHALISGFTKQYGVHMLVWYEPWSDVYGAIAREKQLKGWNRDWKIRLIGEMNPAWDDLYSRLLF